jgi:hypothetical protein
VWASLVRWCVVAFMRRGVLVFVVTRRARPAAILTNLRRH